MNPTSDTIGESLSERRGSSRFPLRQEVSYRQVQGQVFSAGLGQTVDISSGGVLFTTEAPLAVGRPVEFSVNWPVLLNETCALKFVASGRVVRSEPHRAAVRIERYEFRTRARAPLGA